MSGKLIFENELYAMQQNLLALDTNLGISSKQAQFIASMMQQGIGKHYTRKMRILVLRLWAGEAIRVHFGIEINSSYNITGNMAKYLLDLLYDEESDGLTQYGKEFLIHSTKYIEKQLSIPQRETV